MADDRFYVKTLRLQNFRCFEDVELGPFDPHFNLLVGENGAGKSSVLVAIAKLFQNLFVYSDEKYSLVLGDSDDRRSIPLDLNRSPWRLHSEFESESASYEIYDLREKSARKDFWPLFRTSQSDLTWQPSNNWPRNDVRSLIVLYDVRRQFGDNLPGENLPARKRNLQGAESDEGHANWTSAGLSSYALREWFKDQTLSALQIESRRRDGVANVGRYASSIQLNIVKSAVAEVLTEALRVEYDAELKDISVMLRDQRILKFSSLSDGQRALVGLVADIARRACLLNWNRLGGETLGQTPGLVLIDEIDLHLHPKWQRQIVPALKRVFPKIQFFATTHSPQVIGEAKPEEIVLLTPQGQKRPGPSGSYGRESNWILECIMDAEGRDPTIAKRLKDIWDAIEDSRFGDARTQIVKLRADIGEDPDIIGAESYMWRVEHLGDEAAE